MTQIVFSSSMFDAVTGITTPVVYEVHGSLKSGNNLLDRLFAFHESLMKLGKVVIEEVSIVSNDNGSFIMRFVASTLDRAQCFFGSISFQH